MRRASQVSWPLVVAVSAIAVLLGLPSTRWLVAEQLRLQLRPSRHMSSLLADLGVRDLPGGSTPTRDPADYAAIREAALRRPDDAGAMVVAASFDRSGDRLSGPDAAAQLRKLAIQHPDQPEIWAALLRSLARATVRLGRYEEQEYLSASPAPARSFPPRSVTSSKDFAGFLTAATQGAAADPGNAFFPTMRMLALFGMRRDTEGLAALHAAASAKRWDDYCYAETETGLALSRAALGRHGAVPEICVISATLFPHYAHIRAGARIALYRAAKAEEAGNAAGGLRIRHDLMRLAAVMRTDSPTMLGSLVAIALTTMAASHPGGSKAAAARSDEDAEARSSRAAAAYAAYLTRAGRRDEARWASRQFAAGREVRAIIKDAMPRSVVTGTPMRLLMPKWMLGLTVLALAVWCGLVGGLGAVMVPDAAARRRGIVLCVAGIALMSWFAWTQTQNARLYGALPVVIDNLTSGDSDQTGEAAMLAGYSEFVAGFSTFGVPVALIGVPLVLLGVAALVAAAGRKPVWSTVCAALRGAAMALAVVYALLAVDLAHHEDRLSSELARLTAHEGQYMAEIIGRKWPAAG